MNKVANTYWDNSQTVWKRPQTRSSAAANPRNAMNTKTSAATPQWFVFAVVASITFMLCLTINFRAFSEINQETSQNETLTTQVDSLTAETLLLQEEVHNLKNNSSFIEREARKMGFSRPNEKISVPTN